MFKALQERAAALAGRRAAARRDRLAARMAERVPAGVAVAAEDEAVVLSGRRIGRRRLVEPALRWLVAEARDE